MAEVTLHETTSKYQTMDWNPRRDAISTFVNDEDAANLTNDSELVDIARNPCSSIKSIYFAPSPSGPSVLPDDFTTAISYKSKRHQRVSPGMETLLKIDYELSPLQYQYSEIIGKARALDLSGFGLDISSRHRSDMFSQSILSSSASDYFPDHMFSREAATSIRNVENLALVDKTTSPFASFSMVGKSAPARKGSYTNCLYETGSNLSRRQEALDLASRDTSCSLEKFDRRVGSSASYLPTTDIHASQGKTVLCERSCDQCVSNSSIQLDKLNTTKEKDVSARQTLSWSVHGAISASSSSLLRRTTEQHDSCQQFLEKFVARQSNVQISNDKMQEQRPMSESSLDVSHQWEQTPLTTSNYTSKSTIVKVIDNSWHVDDDEQARKERLNEHFEILSDNQHSMAVQTMREGAASSERVTRNDQISSPFELDLIERAVDRQIPRAISASSCAPQIRVVSVNTKFRATVEKCYTSRAVSPIQSSRIMKDAVTTSMTRSPSNVILAARVSSVFIREVRANSSTEMVQTESPSGRSLVNANKRDDINISKRSFSVQKIDSRVKSSSEFAGRDDEVDSTMAGRKRARHLHVPETKERITIVPIVLTDGQPEPPKMADVDFAVPRYSDKTDKAPNLSYKIIPFDARKSQKNRSRSDSGDETSHHGIAKPACLSQETTKEKLAHGASIRRIQHSRGLYTRENYAPSTNLMKVSKRSIQVTTSRKAREYRELTERSKQRSVKAIPGMRSSPEDFLCDTWLVGRGARALFKRAFRERGTLAKKR